MLLLALDKCLVLGPDPIAIQCRLHTQLLQEMVISLQKEVPIHACFLEDVTVLVQLVLLQEVKHGLQGILCLTTL